MNQRNCLWYQKPAFEWIEALPIGNGRMGAMVYGGSVEERIQIDESTFWSGAPSLDNNRKGTKERMEEIRRALLEEDYEKADRLGHDFVGNKNQYGTNLPVGEWKISLLNTQGNPEELVRELCLEEGIARTSFRLGNSLYSRECFLSNPAQVFCLRLEAEEPCSLEIQFQGIGNNTHFTGFDKGKLWMEGDALETLHSDGKHGVHLWGCVEVSTDGRISFQDGKVFVENLRKLDAFLDMETTMFLEHPGELAEQRVSQAKQKGYEGLRSEHVRDVGELFGRIEFFLGEEEKQKLPTDIRLQRVREGEEDLDMYRLMYQYGRYILIASSRENSPLPTHMGGIWNDNIYNRIDCTQDMHIDMNLQMQYWACAAAALPECYEPFFQYLEKVLIPSGKRTAREVYGASGWTAHVVSNPWGFTSLGWAYNWGVFSLGGAWCAAMVWDYYEYTKDKTFLQKRGIPILEGAVRFVLDYVFWDGKRGFYMTGPSYSPENQFSVNGKNYFLALSNTCDVLLVRELLNVYLRGMEELREEGEAKTELEERAEKVKEKLPPYQIGEKGQLQEWFSDFEEPIPNHRHTSHLLGLYPFWQIKPEQKPELARACRVSIERRYENFEVTSWGMNLLIGYFARLKDGAGAQRILRAIFQQIVKDNMASVMAGLTSMWKGTWELDGNTGLTAAISELLAQSFEKEIFLLPALPPSWKEGYIEGVPLKGRGRAKVRWKDGMLEEAVIEAGTDGTYRIHYGGKQVVRELQAKEHVRLDGKLQEL